MRSNPPVPVGLVLNYSEENASQLGKGSKRTKTDLKVAAAPGSYPLAKQVLNSIFVVAASVLFFLSWLDTRKQRSA